MDGVELDDAKLRYIAGISNEGHWPWRCGTVGDEMHGAQPLELVARRGMGSGWG